MRINVSKIKVISFFVLLACGINNLYARTKLLNCIDGNCSNVILRVEADNRVIDFGAKPYTSLKLFFSFKKAQKFNGNLKLELIQGNDLVSISHLKVNYRQAIAKFRSFLTVKAFNGTKEFIINLKDDQSTVIASYRLNFTGKTDKLTLDSLDNSCTEESFDQCNFDRYFLEFTELAAGHFINREINLTKKNNGQTLINIPTAMNGKNSNSFDRMSTRKEVSIAAQTIEKTIEQTLNLGDKDLNGVINLGSTDGAYPAILLEESSLTNTPINGAFEYDGRDLYFTASDSRLVFSKTADSSVPSSIDSADIIDQSILLRDLNPEILAYMNGLATTFSVVIKDNSLTPEKLLNGSSNPSPGRYYGTDGNSVVGFVPVDFTIPEETINDLTVEFTEPKKVFKFTLSGNSNLNFTDINQAHTAILMINGAHPLTLPDSVSIKRGSYDETRAFHNIVLNVIEDQTGREIIEGIFNNYN
jgi:hypothetical protein